MTRIEKLQLGLSVLAKYPGGDVAAEHDIIYAGPSGDEVAEDDADHLRTLGWHRDSESGGWAFFT
jgi:hypothetical protein